MHFASRAFWDKYGKLPAEVRALADKNYELLKADARHPSVRLKRIGRFWGARVGRNYRAVGVEVEDGILWIWIGPHAEYETLIRS